MRSGKFAILLAVIVAFAVGVCPCGLAVAVTQIAQPLSRAGLSADTKMHCPACATANGHSKDSNRQSREQRCAATVSGEAPAAPVFPAALIAASFAVNPVELPERPFAPAEGTTVRTALSLSGSTLLHLCCAFNG